jgi:hypothetical protein
MIEAFGIVWSFTQSHKILGSTGAKPNGQAYPQIYKDPIRSRFTQKDGTVEEKQNEVGQCN